MNSEQNLTREKAIAILNTPDEQLNELIERAGALRKNIKGIM
jgi:biotin synthase (EC 2.8.1.6)